MRSILVAVLALFAITLPARADWPLDKMNAQVEQTNVIVSGICSGTVIDVKLRLVLTAYHCVTNNLREVEKKEIDPKTGEIKITKVQERIPMYIETWKRDESLDVVSSARFSAVIKGADSASDTALLQVEDQAWTPEAAAPFAPDGFKYLRGLVVYAVGNPAIIFDNSITVGIISAPARKLDFGDGRKIPLFQHSANTIGGNSGGAIYNADGQIIGTLTGGMRGADISLAVPISYSKAMITKAGFGAIFK
jgi:S1-C subfamily serine protease